MRIFVTEREAQRVADALNILYENSVKLIPGEVKTDDL